MVEQRLFPEKGKKRSRETSTGTYPDSNEARKSGGTASPSRETQEKRSTETKALEPYPERERSQEIMVEQHLLPEKGKKREVGRQGPEPCPD